MNRDWFLQTQAETRARVAAYLRWQPHVTIDAHEMGTNTGHYYFDPPAEPILELITPKQRDWFARFGRRQGRRFDEFGFGYTTREVYDAFYPGYGSTWPVLHGSIGILWEQPGARGLVVDREDGTTLHYHDGVRHHYVSSLSTVETAAAHARELVADFANYRASAVATRPRRAGPRLPPPARRHPRPRREAGRPARQERHRGPPDDRPGEGQGEGGPRRRREGVDRPGRELSRPRRPARRRGSSARSSTPTSTWARTFRKRQLDRKARRLGDEIYDLTAWSLPTAFGIKALAVVEARDDRERAGPEPDVDRPRRRARAGEGRLPRPRPRTTRRCGSSAGPLRLGLRVHVFDQPTTLGGVKFAKGTLLLRTADNPDRLHEASAAPRRARPDRPRDRHRARRRGGRARRLRRDLGQAARRSRWSSTARPRRSPGTPGTSSTRSGSTR